MLNVESAVDVGLVSGVAYQTDKVLKSTHNTAINAKGR